MNFRHFTPIDARGTLEREAGAKNSYFMVIMGINQLSMERGIEWAAQMYSTSILPVENGSTVWRKSFIVGVLDLG